MTHNGNHAPRQEYSFILRLPHGYETLLTERERL
jgi:hypothetical protein